MAHGSDLLAARVAAFHDAVLASWRDDEHAPAPLADADGVWHWIERDHVCNALLWRAEARARRSAAPDAEVAQCKRTIDRHHQVRLEAVELMDAALLELFDRGGADPAARLSSETPGTMIDRLSTLSLQILHARRLPGGCAAPWRDARLKPLEAQRRDLCECLDRLLRELADGTACFHLYRPPAFGPRPPHPAALA